MQREGVAGGSREEGMVELTNRAQHALHSAVGSCTEQRTVSVCSPSQTWEACPHDKYSAHIVHFFSFFLFFSK